MAEPNLTRLGTRTQGWRRVSTARATCYFGEFPMISPFVAAAPTSSRLRRRRATQVRQRSEGSAELVFTSSMGNEFSLERHGWNNGAFAKAVVRGGAEVPVIMIPDFE